ncbi:MAG: hypothetical protein J0J15_13395, partial [Mesorhizobium sp.]|nr:hypothetical protein [Mesorhizobium sp.]
DAEYLALTGHHGGAPDPVAGVLASAVVDNEHWLGAGVAPTLSVMVRGSDIYTPLARDQGTNVVRLAGPARNAAPWNRIPIPAQDCFLAVIVNE